MTDVDAMPPPHQQAGRLSGSDRPTLQHRPLLWVLSAATFLIFFQAFMVAPLIPRLAEELGASTRVAGVDRPGLHDPLRRRDAGVRPGHRGEQPAQRPPALLERVQLAMREQTFPIKHIHCQGCERTIRTLLEEVDGIHRVQADRRANTVTVGFYEARLTAAAVATRLSDADYPTADASHPRRERFWPSRGRDVNDADR